MSKKHQFLFTYSVQQSGTTTESKAKLAQKVRDAIATVNFSGWVKELTVETAFYGFIELDGPTIEAKRLDAERIVRHRFEDLCATIKEYSAKEIDIFVVLMVDGLGEKIAFYL